MPCFGPAEIERIAVAGLANVAGAAEHVGGCAACAATLGAHIRANRTTGATDAEQLGRYHLLAERGRGAFGRVWEAYDPALDRRVALKTITFSSDRPTPDALAELLREATAMAQIQHPNVIPIYDAGRSDDAVYITMPIVDGDTLDAWAARARTAGTLDADRVLVGFGRQLAAGLSAIHAAGFVHRDLKPSNVLVAGGTAWVADLGLARRTTRATAITDAFAGGELLSSRHTVSFAGTPAYMAPECLAGEAATPASDQFALAATLVEAVSGHRPFDAASYWALLDATRARPPDLAGVPRRYHAALARALHPDPARRFASVGDLAAALVAARPPASGAWRYAVLAVAPALVVAAGWWWTARGSAIARSDAASPPRDAAVTSLAMAPDAAAITSHAAVPDTAAATSLAAVPDAAATAASEPPERAASSRGPSRPRVAASAAPRTHGTPGGRTDEPSARTEASSTRINEPTTRADEPTTRTDASSARTDAPSARTDESSPHAPASPRACATAADCRATYRRCTDAAAARLTTFDDARKRGWATCASANTTCKAGGGGACAAELTRCNAAVAADYDRASDEAQRADAACLAARNACLACR